MVYILLERLLTLSAQHLLAIWLQVAFQASQLCRLRKKKKTRGPKKRGPRKKKGKGVSFGKA